MTEAGIHSQPFSLTKADYTEYYMAIYFRAFTTLPTAIWMWLVVVVPLPALTFGELKAAHYFFAALIVLSAMLVWFVVIPTLGMFSLLGTLSRAHNAYLERIAIVSQANFTIEGQGFADHRSWAQFRKVIVTGRLVFLSLTSGMGMIVPNSAFVTQSERDAFVAACRRLITGSRNRQANVFDAPMPMISLHEGGLETPPFTLGFPLFSKFMFLSLLRAFTRPAMGLIGAGLLGFSLWSHRANLALGDFSSLLITLGEAGAWLLIFIPLMIILNWILVRGRPLIRNPRRVAISPDHIRVYGDGFDITTDWFSVRRVDRRFSAIQFWTGPATSIAVPLSAFPSSDVAKAFQHQATAWWTAVRKS